MAHTCISSQIEFSFIMTEQYILHNSKSRSLNHTCNMFQNIFVIFSNELFIFHLKNMQINRKIVTRSVLLFKMYATCGSFRCRFFVVVFLQPKCMKVFPHELITVIAVALINANSRVIRNSGNSIDPKSFGFFFALYIRLNIHLKKSKKR